MHENPLAGPTPWPSPTTQRTKTLCCHHPRPGPHPNEMTKMRNQTSPCPAELALSHRSVCSSSCKVCLAVSLHTYLLSHPGHKCPHAMALIFMAVIYPWPCARYQSRESRIRGLTMYSRHKHFHPYYNAIVNCCGSRRFRKCQLVHFVVPHRHVFSGPPDGQAVPGL